LPVSHCFSNQSIFLIKYNYKYDFIIDHINTGIYLPVLCVSKAGKILNKAKSQTLNAKRFCAFSFSR